MADFKLLGGTDPVGSSLGVMTQGLGFPLRDVEPSTSGGPVTVKDEICLSSESFVDQNPSGLGIATQITFGAADATAQFSIDAAGNMECLEEDEYECAVTFVVGREGSGGIAQIYLRALINGSQVGSSRHAILDTDDFEIPLEYNVQFNLQVGDILTFEMIRDTDGSNSGGLRAGIPDVPWNPSPSAFIQISRTLAVQS